MPGRGEITERFGSPDVAAGAPGRVNLIGDHVDYAGGVVLPCAIDRSCTAAIYRNACKADALTLSSLNTGEDMCVPFGDALLQRRLEGEPGWTPYVRGVIAGLGERGSVEELRGCRVAVSSDVPMGGGLSSSAALEVSVAIAARELCGIEVERLELAKLCQRAEQRYAGVPCGLMDQAVSVLAQPEHLLLLDCADETYAHVPLPSACELHVINSGVSHALADGAYADRRARCEEAARLLGVRHLARAEEAGVDALPTGLQAIARHVINETSRVREMAAVLRSGDLERAGALMFASHASLRNEYEVSCAEVDAIVDVLRETEGVYGARMTGGGFGGCVVALAKPGSDETMAHAVKACSTRNPGISWIRAAAVGGGRLLDVQLDRDR